MKTYLTAFVSAVTARMLWGVVYASLDVLDWLEERNASSAFDYASEREWP